MSSSLFNDAIFANWDNRLFFFLNLYQFCLIYTFEKLVFVFSQTLFFVFLMSESLYSILASDTIHIWKWNFEIFLIISCRKSRFLIFISFYRCLTRFNSFEFQTCNRQSFFNYDSHSLYHYQMIESRIEHVFSMLITKRINEEWTSFSCFK